MSSTNQFWAYVEINALLISTGATTTFTLSNRPVLTETTFYPILKSVDGLGSQVGDALPITQSGRITLDNSPGSLGYERRFQDLLERYTITDTEVKVYSAFTTATDNEITTDKQQDFKGKITRYSVDPENGNLTLEVTGKTIEKRDVTKPIDTSSFATAPDASKGQTIPLVLGSAVTVKPIQIDPAGTTTPRWVYCTTFADDYVPSGVQTYYVKNLDGKYESVRSATSASSVQFYQDEGGSSVTTGYITVGYERAIPLISPSTENYILTEAVCSGMGTGGTVTPIDGSLILRIYEKTTSSATPDKLIVTSERLKSDYDAQLRLSVVFTIQWPISPYVVLSPTKTYYASVQETLDTSPTRVFQHRYYRDAGSTLRTYYQRNTTSDPWSTFSLSNHLDPTLGFYCVKFTDTQSPSSTYWDAEGRGQALYQATQNAAFPGLEADLSKLDMIVSVDGIKDDGSGTLSGSASSVLTTPLSQLKLLMTKYDTSTTTWGLTAGPLDTSKLSATQTHISSSSSRYYRLTGGATQGKTTLENLIAAICRNSASRVALVNSTTSSKYLGVYGWGVSLTSQATITDEDSKVTKIEERGTETIVNRVQFAYGKTLLNIDLNALTANGSTANYASNLDWRNGTSALVTDYTSGSDTLYGKRYLANTFYDFIQSSTSAEHFAEYLVSNFNRPSVYVELRVPLQKYRTLEIFDVVEILHPDLPAYFGSSSDPKVVHYLGADADVLKGFPLKRATRYRAQIEGRTIDYNLSSGIPELVLITRLLLNYPKDPT